MKQTVRRLLQRPRPDSGFTLVEVLVAMTIFAVIAVAAGSGLQSAMSATAGNSQRIVASSLVSQELDLVQATPFTSVTKLNGRTTSSTDAGVRYTTTDIVQAASPPASPGGTCNFSAAGTDGEFLVVDVTVNWLNMRGVAPATGQVELSPPASAISAGYANETLQIFGATNLPVAGIQISGSGASSSTQTTDSNGCAFFSGLPPATTYTFTSLGGFIDQTQADQATTPPTATWTTPTPLAANSANYQPLTWDRPTAVSVTLAPPAGDLAPTGGLGNVWVNLQANVAGSPKDTLVDLASATNVNVFPYSGGWRTWAGSCNAADPGAAASGPITTLANAPASGVAPLFTAAIKTTKALISGQTITATAATDGGCLAGQTLTYSTPGGPINHTYKLAVPVGTWTFKYSSAPVPGSVTVTVTTANTAAGTL